MMREPEDFYKIREVMEKKQWVKEMKEWLGEQQEILHIFTEAYLDDTNEDSPEDKEWYNERILALTDAIPHNLRMLKRVELEADYMILYREDGHLGCMVVSPEERRNIYSRKKTRERMVV